MRGKSDFLDEKNLGPAYARPKFYCAHQDLPSGKIPDEIFLQAGLAVFAFRGLRTLKQKHRSAFQVPSQAKQFACLGIKICPCRKGRGKFYCAHQDLNLEPTDSESVALTD